jgi:hypothetical protein
MICTRLLLILVVLFISQTVSASPPTASLLAAPPRTAIAPPAPTFLRCEYLLNPIGIDAPHPRLTWRLEDARKTPA